MTSHPDSGPRTLREKARRAGRAALMCLAGIGGASTVAVIWLLGSWPLGIDSWLDVSGTPERADAIICLGGGTGTGLLPTDEGWSRIYTASQLFIDGYAPLVIFSGGGSQDVSEAEVYTDAGAWLGIPREAMLVDAGPTSTAEHARTLLQAADGRLRRDSHLLLVTSRVHSRRALLTFRKQGFTSVRVVSGWTAHSTGGLVPGHVSKSAVPGFAPHYKPYDDPLLHLRDRSRDALVAMREWTAIAWYWWRGDL